MRPTSRRFTLPLSLIFHGLLGAQEAPPERYSLGGLSGFITTITGGAGWGITAVAPAGDVDADGLEDLLVRRVYKAGNREDEVFIIYGGSLGVGALDLEAEGLRKTLIRTGTSTAATDLRERSHSSVSGSRDVDGDAKPDLLVASGFEPAAGGPALLVISTSGQPFPSEIEGSKIGRELKGTLITDSGGEVSGVFLGQLALLVNDLNGDGLAEIAVADHGYWTGGQIPPSPGVYVIFGRNEFPSTVDLGLVGTDEVPGFRFEPAIDSRILEVASLGDVDGDGLSELGISLSPERDDPKSILLFGQNDWPGFLSEEDPAQGDRVILSQYGMIGGAGDVDGDGWNDVLLDITVQNPHLTGEAHLLYGRARDGLPSTINPTVFKDGALGSAIKSPDANFLFAEGRDVDGDGRPEVFGALPNSSVTYGAAAVDYSGGGYLLQSRLRPTSRLPEVMDIDQIAGGAGVRVDGIGPHDRAGQKIHSLADFLGAGRGSLLIASYFGDCQPPFRDEFKLWLVPLDGFRKGDPPQLSFIFPERGPQDGGNEVLLLGAGFTGTPIVTFGGREAKVKEVWGAGIAVVEAPRGDGSGLVPIKLRTGAGEVTMDGSYFYTAQRSVRIGPSGQRSIAVRNREKAAYRSGGIGAGDFNGDGKTDLVVSKLKVGGREAIFDLLFGQRNGRRDLEIESLGPVEHSRISSPSSDGPEALNVIAGGDLNGDGFGDLLLFVEPGRGLNDEFRLVFGRPQFPAEVRFKDLAGTVRFYSQDPNRFIGGTSIFVPDLNGDGLDDLILTGLHSGLTSVYVVKGRRDWNEGEILLDELADQRFGAELMVKDVELATVAGNAGDFNGDRRPDIFFGGSGVVVNGALAVIYGDPILFDGRPLLINRGLFGDSAGLFATGPSFTAAGISFNAAFPGPIGQDLSPYLFMVQDDLVTCSLAPLAGGGVLVDHGHLFDAGIPDTARPVLEQLYAGKDVGLPDFAPGPPGAQDGVIRLQGEVPGEILGYTAIPAGDFDGDGSPDLLLGAPGAGFLDPFVASPSSGACYLIRGGGLDPTKPLVRMSDLGDRGIRFFGDGVYGFGITLAAGFDWDGDGHRDLLVGAYYGESYIIFGGPETEVQFIRGDSNGDRVVDLSDGVSILGFLFLGTGEPSCKDVADADDDGALTITDAIYLLSHLFLGGPQPPAPYPDAGIDPTDEDLFHCRG